ncbi:MAG: response regulator transcription factor [Bacteroidia bacterium]
MKILIIDDDKTTVYGLTHYLKEKGHSVAAASDGEAAIREAVQAHDVILSDVMMPGISGLSLISILRTTHLCTTPIIMMSSLVNQPLLDAAFEAGANGFIAKPVNTAELEENLRKFNPKPEN